MYIIKNRRRKKNKIPNWLLILYEPSSRWEVNVDGDAGLAIILNHDWADHKTLADHKLLTQCIRFIILGELVPHRSNNWCSLRVGLEKQIHLKKGRCRKINSSACDSPGRKECKNRTIICSVAGWIQPRFYGCLKTNQQENVPDDQTLSSNGSTVTSFPFDTNGYTFVPRLLPKR